MTPNISPAVNTQNTLPFVAPASELEALDATFDTSFLDRHTGLIMSDPYYAVVELVANAWDAGANRVNIQWPTHLGDVLSIQDNGHGMTRDEFSQRWRQLNYNRIQHQGEVVEFPPDVPARKRTALEAYNLSLNLVKILS